VTPRDPIAAARAGAARYVHAKLEAREPIELLVLPNGIPEPVPGLPGWLDVGWLLRHGQSGWWDVLSEPATGSEIPATRGSGAGRPPPEGGLRCATA
jgi:hypothetical protein